MRSWKGLRGPAWGCLGLLCFLLSACLTVSPGWIRQAPPGEEESAPERAEEAFLIVTAESGETLSSLAGRYLDDPAQAWLLARVNETETLVPGQKVIIPLQPVNQGGLQPEGYQTVPVLAYQGFSPDKPGELTVTQADSAAQMRLLQEKGYTVITTDQFFDFLDFKTEIPPQSVLITIDDTSAAVYDLAFPILKKHGFPATLFIQVHRLGRKDALSWAQLAELKENGFDLQGQPGTSFNLAAMREGESFQAYLRALEEAVTKPRQILREHLKVEGRYLAYPQGQTNNLLISVLEKHGYRGAFTLNPGSTPFFTDNYLIPRALIHGTDTLADFEENLQVFAEEELQ